MIAFMCLNGCDVDIGVTAGDEGESRNSHQIAAAAKKIVVVTTAGQVVNRAFARIRKPNQVNALITDEGIDPDLGKALEERRC